MSAIIKQLGKIDKKLSKTDIETLAVDDVKLITQDEKYDLLKVLIELKRYDVYLNKLIETIKEPALVKAMNMGEKKFDYADAKVWITNKVVYDYSVDKTWTQLNNNINTIKEKLKKHQAFLKELDNANDEIINEETGEVIEVTPPIKTEETSLMIRI